MGVLRAQLAAKQAALAELDILAAAAQAAATDRAAAIAELAEKNVQISDLEEALLQGQSANACFGLHNDRKMEVKNCSLLIYTGLPPAAQEDNSAAATIAEELRADAEAAVRDTGTCLAAKEAQVADMMQRLADAHVDAGAKAVNLESQVRSQGYDIICSCSFCIWPCRNWLGY